MRPDLSKSGIHAKLKRVRRFKFMAKLARVFLRRSCKPVDLFRISSDIQAHGRLALPGNVGNGAIALELGVASGYFSEAILRHKNIAKLYSVDSWNDHHDEVEYCQAVARLSVFGVRSVVLRSFFDEMLGMFPDGYFDFIYVDAYAHTGQNGGKYFYDWFPKCKPGGVFGGHDYNFKETQVAVDNFVSEINCRLHIVKGINTNNPEDLHSSWYIIKPQ